MKLGAPPLPLFLLLEARTVLVVGGGPVAYEKALAIKAAGAFVRVVSPAIRPELVGVADAVETRAFVDADVDGAWLVFAAAPPEVNREVKRAADARRVFTVAVDDVESCSAIGAAQLQRGGLTVAISSSGRAPALVALLRRALEALLPDDVEAWLAIAEATRTTWKGSGIPFAERRPLLLRTLNAMYGAAATESGASGESTDA